MNRAWGPAALLFWASGAAALDLAPAGATLTGTEGPIADAVVLPRGPWVEGKTPEGTGGRVTRQAWRLAGRRDTPLQITAPIETRLRDQGFDIVFACSDSDCGGFDFRFQLSLLPAPAMFVDLGDYRYVLAERETAEGAEIAALVASRTDDAGMLHVTHVEPLGSEASSPSEAGVDDGEAIAPVAPLVRAVPTTTTGLDALDQTGRIVVEGLDFASGAGALSAADYPALTALSAWLAGRPDVRLLLVGHTDAVGALDANLSLSERRAASVAARLRELAPEAADRITSAGAGYLAPIATNETEEGRAANRRVEAVLLPR